MKFWVAVITGLTASACGDDEARCEDAGKALCAKACACGLSECAVGKAGAAWSMTWATTDDGEAFYVGLGCSGGNAEVDFEACVSDLRDAACVTFQDQTRGVEPPAPCESEPI